MNSRCEYQPLTAPGPAAIAVVRLTGSAVPAFVERRLRSIRNARLSLAAGVVVHCNLVADDDSVVDDIVVTVVRGAPDWDVRLHLHGGIGVMAACTELLERAGFTARREPPRDLWPAADAFEAETFALLPQLLTLRGVRWLIGSTQRTKELNHRGTEAQRKPDGKLNSLNASPHFKLFSISTRIALAGPTNAGKSTLINRLTGADIALVSAEPGTTRDWLEAPAEIDGFPVLWLDTAGLRATSDEIEAEGIRRTLRIIAEADHFILVLDESDPHSAADAIAALQTANRIPSLIALNKSDLRIDARAVRDLIPAAWATELCEISAATGAGVDAFMQSIRDRAFPADAELNN